MENFRFESPAYLLILLALPLMQLVLSRIHSNARERLLRFVAANNLSALLKERGRGGGGLKRILFWAGLTLAIVALARPQANPTVEELEGASLDIYILLDVSRSMDAEDVPPSRLKKAKRAIESLTQQLAGDRVGVIAFAGTAVMISPLTADYEVIKTFLQNVDTTLIQNQGTDISGALAVAEAAMKRGAEKTGDQGPRTNVFIVMSDGEDHTPENMEIVDKIREEGGTVFTIAFGTEAGATIPTRTERGELVGHKRDRQGNEVKTTVQTKSLEEIAKRGGGQFYFSTLEEGEIHDILQRVQGMSRTGAAVMKARVYEELFGPVLALALFLVLFSFFSARTLFSGISRIRFKRPSFLLLLLLPAWAEASPLSFLWDKEKRAFDGSQRLAAEGKPDEAVNNLKELLAENPDDPELNYDIGAFLLEGKKADEARTQWQRLVDRPNPLREKALYNIAGSYAQEGKKEPARAAYGELIRFLQGKERNAEDQRLLDDAKKNLARLSEQQQQQQQQNQSGEGGGQDQQPKDQEKKNDPGKQDQQKGQGQDKDPGKNQDKKDNQDNSDKKEEKKDGKGEDEKKDQNQGKGEQPKPEQESGEGDQDKQEQSPPKGMRRGRAPFKEKSNMGEADAKQILDALKDRETGLQKKFLKNKGKEGNFSDDDGTKDW